MSLYDDWIQEERATRPAARRTESVMVPKKSISENEFDATPSGVAKRAFEKYSLPKNYFLKIMHSLIQKQSPMIRGNQKFMQHLIGKKNCVLHKDT